MSYPQAPGVSRHTMERMSDNTSQRKALQQLESESDYDRITYYQKPFMVLWAAVQEASSELQDDYALSPELAQLWVAEQIRKVSDSLVDRLAETALAQWRVEIECGARGRSKSRQRVCGAFLGSRPMDRTSAR